MHREPAKRGLPFGHDSLLSSLTFEQKGKLVRVSSAAAFTATVFGLVTAAHAAGAQPAPAPADAPAFTGYIDVHAGLEGASSAYYDPTLDDSYDFRGPTIGGAARGVIDVAPQLSTQVDVWGDFNALQETGAPSYYTYGTTNVGVGDHLTWHPTENDAVGVLGSIGEGGGYYYYGGGFSGNLAVEAAHTGDNWRIYAQAGAVKGLTGYLSYCNMMDLYANLEAEYFINPNLMLAANAGAHQMTLTDSPYTSTENGLFWGAKVEFKPDQLPASFYVAYKGTNQTVGYSEYPSESYKGVDNQVLVGLRVPLGGDSVQALENKDGLKDYNPTYGASAQSFLYDY